VTDGHPAESASPRRAARDRQAERDRTIAAALERWFRTAARDLPWRRGRTGWTGLVSEAMLQQTQVARVAERYPAFLERFPTPAAMADATDDDVLALWSGLGYYGWARRLRAAAVAIRDDHGGEVPAESAVLRRLPGVGPYTAGAIASIVFGERTPIVDGNVERVVARLDLREDAPSPAETKRTWARARDLVDAADEPGVLNEALMELGATVCTPAAPRCDACPVAAACCARAAGRTGEIPRPKIRSVRTRLHAHAVVIERRGRILLERRPDRGLWAGLWQVPTIEGEAPPGPEDLRAALPIAVATLEPLGRFEFVTTHRLVAFEVLRAEPRPRARAVRGEWLTPEEVVLRGLGSAQRRVLELASPGPRFGGAEPDAADGAAGQG